MGDLRTTLLAQGLEESGQGGLVLAGGGPHQPAGVVVDHHGQVLVAALVGDLVDPDPPQPGEQVHLAGGVGPDPGDDRPDGAPRDPHQLGDRGLRALGGQPGHLLVEGQRVAGAVTGPGHLPHRRPVDRAAHPRRIGLEEHLHHAQVERPPAAPTLAAVVPSRTAPAHPAPASRRPRGTHVRDDHLAVLVELDLLDDRLLDAQQGAP